MSTWTDDELGDLLREAFHDHEEADDADRALRIARPAAYPVRRRPPLGVIAVAASLVAVTGLGVLAARAIRNDTGSSASSTAAAGAAAGGALTDEANREAARGEAQRLLAEVPLPAGAVRQDHMPTTDRPLTVAGGALVQDTSLDQVAWWIVPVSPSDFGAYVHAHVPPGLRGAAGVSGSVGTASWVGAGTSRYTAPILTLTWAQSDGGTVVRADAFIGARSVRSTQSLVSGRVSGVDVRIAGAKPIADTYTDQRTIARLRDLFNGLPGAFHNEGKALGQVPCPSGPVPPTTATVSFHLANGVILSAKTIPGGSPATCSDSMRVTRDGHEVLPPLDPAGFVAGAAAIVR